MMKLNSNKVLLFVSKKEKEEQIKRDRRHTAITKLLKYAKQLKW